MNKSDANCVPPGRPDEGFPASLLRLCSDLFRSLAELDQVVIRSVSQRQCQNIIRSHPNIETMPFFSASRAAANASSSNRLLDTDDLSRLLRGYLWHLQPCLVRTTCRVLLVSVQTVKRCSKATANELLTSLHSAISVFHVFQLKFSGHYSKLFILVAAFSS